jgi:hypothetical protein
MNMKNLNWNRRVGNPRRWVTWSTVLAAMALAGVAPLSLPLPAQQPPAAGVAVDADGAEVQTRGPVHEAFAGIVTYNPEAGVVVTKAPPNPIEELPPEEKPEGDNVTWIPGYWAWDDERNDYLWISGTWRALPPGRTWVAGYWGKTGQGFQWTSGYWVDSAQTESTYLPTPPATVESGPNVPAPSIDYVWMPGCWIWSHTHYVWRPGYWSIGRPDWDWVPAHYIWTPRGHLFVSGYWDYPVARRGILFAPVFFTPHFHSHFHHRPYVYSPSIIIDTGVFADHLFCRPRYHHYYFGDYYAPAYVSSGFYASFSFHIGRRGYDPIYSHHRWAHRHERDWHHRLEVSHRHRRDHADARPPRTWAQQRNVTINQTRIENRVVVANTLDQYRTRADRPGRLQAVPREERQRLGARTREIQTSREQRQRVEFSPAAASTGTGPATGTAPARDGRPFRAQVAKSSIAAQPIRESASGAASASAPPPTPRAARDDDRNDRNARTVREGNDRREGRNPSENRGRPSREAQPGAVSPERPAATQPQPETRVPQERSVPSRPQRDERAPATRAQPEVVPPTPTPRATPAPSRPQTQPERTVPVNPGNERRVNPAPAPAPSTPPPSRQVPSRPQPQPERSVVTPPAQPRTPPPQRAPQERSIPARPQPEGRSAVTVPQESRRMAPETRGRMAAPEQSQRQVRQPERPQNQNPNRGGRKGAEQLHENNRRDR